MKLKKSTYILILLMITAQFWTIIPLAYIFNAQVIIFFILVWFLYGIITYKGRSKDKKWKSKSKGVWWILFAVFFSFIPAWLFHGQSIVQSFITSRNLLTYLAVPLILYINPTKTEIRKAIVTFSCLTLIVMCFDSYGPINFTITKIRWGIDEPLKAHLPYIEKGAFLHPLLGTPMIMLSCIFYMDDVLKGKKKSLIFVILFLMALFFVQNRTMLGATAVIFLYNLIFSKGSNRNLKFLIFTVVVCLVTLSADVWTALYDETISQLDNKDYDRFTSYYYFLFKASPNIFCEIFGNGFLSDITDKNSWHNAVRGIYNTDVGFIGMWNQFGIIPIIIFFCYIFKSFKSKKTFVIKANALAILLCAPTKAYFVTPSMIMWPVFFFYMYYNWKD